MIPTEGSGSPPAPLAAALSDGDRLGPYVVVGRLGAGGMGEVYRARDEKLGRDVALKVLPARSFSDTAARARLLREARSAAALNHPNICTIYEVGEAGGQDYIAMELVEGESLDARLAAGPFPEELALRYGSQIADALSHAHERQIVHRDLKSANVLLTPDGRAKVLDFGLAKRLIEGELDEVTRSQASLTQPGAIVGTLAYMAPEQLRGQPADVRSDIWALGVMLYEAVTGGRPFAGHTGFELSSAIMREPPAPLPPHISAGMRGVIQRCLQKEPGQRYHGAGEVRAALEAVSSASTGASPAREVPPPARRQTSRKWRLGLSVTLPLLLVLAVVLSFGSLRDRLLGRASAPQIRSLAVLPLENLSRDPEQDYFSDGMTEALITDLSKIGALKVISRTSVMRYKRVEKPLREIARELDVDAVVEGSVLREGGRVRITAQLIEAATDRHLWAERYDRDLRDVLALQSEVAQAIATEIRIQLTPQERERLARVRPVNPHAYELYLKGRFHWSKRTDEGVKKGLEYFNQALAEDPTYALAWAGLADTYLIMGGEYRLLAPPEARPRARAAALKALELDPDLGQAHASLALWHYHQWDWAAAEKEFQRAIELAPNYATAYHWYALLLGSQGHADEALRHLRRAQTLDPLSPPVHFGETLVLYNARRYDEVIETANRLAKLFPDVYQLDLWRGQAYAEKGRFQEALADLEKAATLSHRHPAPVSRLGYVYGRAGRRAEALRIAAELERLSERRTVSPFDRALVYAGLGETDQALAWLEKAYEVRDSSITLNNGSPWFDRLRPNPRYQALLERMNSRTSAGNS